MLTVISKGNPKFDAILKRMKEIHDKKAADYASDANRYSNFESAATSAGTTVDVVFRTLIGVKLARLAELQGKGKVPNNESIMDSLIDLAVYATLYASYYEKAPTNKVIALNPQTVVGVGGTLPYSHGDQMADIEKGLATYTGECCGER